VYEHLNDEQGKHFLTHILAPVHRILDEGGDLASTASGGAIGESRLIPR
jgi:U3 small nucleolar RNA-associated protein 20